MLSRQTTKRTLIGGLLVLLAIPAMSIPASAGIQTWSAWKKYQMVNSYGHMKYAEWRVKEFSLRNCQFISGANHQRYAAGVNGYRILRIVGGQDCKADKVLDTGYKPYVGPLYTPNN